jgi:hypothetical protein
MRAGAAVRALSPSCSASGEFQPNMAFIGQRGHGRVAWCVVSASRGCLGVVLRVEASPQSPTTPLDGAACYRCSCQRAAWPAVVSSGAGAALLGGAFFGACHCLRWPAQSDPANLVWWVGALGCELNATPHCMSSAAAALQQQRGALTPTCLS